MMHGAVRRALLSDVDRDWAEGEAMKVLLVRPPRLTWDHLHLNEDSNNILALGFPCLAAKVRQDLPEVQTTILDCNVEKMGWKSLERYLRENSFDVVGLGSETVYVNADRQVLYWIKKYHPQTKAVAGGVHYAFNTHDLFADDVARFIVRGEGEITFVELLKQMLSTQPDYDSVKGLIWKDDQGQVHDTGWRELVPNLDDLPLPAYDMVPTEKYCKVSMFWHDGITIEHGRGCSHGCNFCTFWSQGAKWNKGADGSWKPTPCYRTKSVERTIEEVELLVKKYNKGFLFFVDGTFEHNIEWTDRFFDEVLRRNLQVAFWTFSRVDKMLELEERGILEKGVRAGWRMALMGIEHNDKATLTYYHKPTETADSAKRLINLIHRKYPILVTMATYVGGAPDDDRKSLGRLYKYAKDLGPDVTTLHFMTPMPGSALHAELKQEGLIKVFDYSRYSWFDPVMATRHMSIEELDNYWTPKMVLVNMAHPLQKFIRMFMGDPHTRRMMRVGFLMYARYIRKLILQLFRQPGARFRSFVKPLWYDN